MSAGAVATVFSYSFKAVLLEGRKFRFIESCLVERARAGGSPMLAMTVGALDDIVPRVRFSSGGVGRRLVIPGAREAPGRFRGAMVGRVPPP